MGRLGATLDFPLRLRISIGLIYIEVTVGEWMQIERRRTPSPSDPCENDRSIVGGIQKRYLFDVFSIADGHASRVRPDQRPTMGQIHNFLLVHRQT